MYAPSPPPPVAPPMAMPSPPALSLSVALRQRRLLGSTLLAVALLLILTAIFNGGVVLKTLDQSATTAAQRAALVDDYNSYSGNIATAFARPLEVFIAMMAQVLVLRVLAPALVHEPRPSWRVAAIALVLAAALGFFVNNGFNALNVQLLEADVRPGVVASDLTAQATDTALRSAYAGVTTNASRSVAETQPRNPVANTILRGLVLPREPKPRAQCTRSDASGFGVTNLRFPDDLVDYGFPQREWMTKLLPEALDANRLRVVINATDASANKDVTSDKLPMNASLAADLFLTSVLLSNTYIPWGKQGTWMERYSRPEGQVGNLTAAVVAGLLPPSNDSASQSEAARRAWFLEKSRTFLDGKRINATSAMRSDLVMEFAHVDVSPSIALDSITWEVTTRELARPTSDSAANESTNATSWRYKRIGGPNCGPLPGVCLFDREASDTPVVVHAFAACAYADGSETLQSLPKGSTATDYFIECPAASNTSLLLVTASKRVVADALQQNATVDDATGEIVPDEGYLVATNLRKIYSFTVARLAWQWENLADKYGAECRANATTACRGLDVALASQSQKQQQRLLAGAASLPMELLSPVNYQAMFQKLDQQPLALVTLMEPAQSSPAYPGWANYAGDLLLPHNAGQLTWDRAARPSGSDCERVKEAREQLVLSNHLYMEATLQTTYTAAMFFLFQNGVVKESLVGAKTLAFDGNVQRLDLRISIPETNAVLTYVGCVVLLGGIACALAWSYVMGAKRLDPLQHITTPHVIARVMLDDLTFPALLLTREINDVPADQFLIESLTLQRQTDEHGHGVRASDAMACGSQAASPVGLSIVTPTHDAKGVALLSKYNEA